MPRKLTPDLPLFGVVVTLVCVGVVMVYSASAIVAADRFHDPFFFLKKQLFWAVLGLGCLWVGMLLDYRWLERLVIPLLVVSFALLVLVLVLFAIARVIGGRGAGQLTARQQRRRTARSRRDAVRYRNRSAAATTVPVFETGSA